MRTCDPQARCILCVHHAMLRHGLQDLVSGLCCMHITPMRLQYCWRSHWLWLLPRGQRARQGHRCWNGMGLLGGESCAEIPRGIARAVVLQESCQGKRHAPWGLRRGAPLWGLEGLPAGGEGTHAEWLWKGCRFLVCRDHSFWGYLAGGDMESSPGSIQGKICAAGRRSRVQRSHCRSSGWHLICTLLDTHSVSRGCIRMAELHLSCSSRGRSGGSRREQPPSHMNLLRQVRR